jgi:hypothetical protein
MYGTSYTVKRLRITTEQGDFIRAYAKSKGISETMAVRTMIENEIRRTNKKRLHLPI